MNSFNISSLIAGNGTANTAAKVQDNANGSTSFASLMAQQMMPSSLSGGDEVSAGNTGVGSSLIGGVGRTSGMDFSGMISEDMDVKDMLLMFCMMLASGSMGMSEGMGGAMGGMLASLAASLSNKPQGEADSLRQELANGSIGGFSSDVIQKADSMLFGGARSANSEVELLNWYGEAEKVFPRQATATITDIRTGISFQMKRTGGYNHADVEPLTPKDTALFKKACGNWSWERRPVLVEVNGRRLAASINCQPHGYDTMPDNGMAGQVCIHFLSSRTHAANKVCPKHQACIMEAYHAVEGILAEDGE